MKIGDAGKSLSTEHIESFFRSIELAADCGLWAEIAALLHASTTAQDIENFGAPNAKGRLQDWRIKLKGAQEYESAHGSRSLYVADHPFNKEMEKLRKLKEHAEQEVGASSTLVLKWPR